MFCQNVLGNSLFEKFSRCFRMWVAAHKSGSIPKMSEIDHARSHLSGKFTISFFSISFFFLMVLHSPGLRAQSLDLAINNYGISLGNSRQFNGLRINFRDRHVERVNGINLTLWRAKENKQAKINGLSLGLIGPDAGSLRGVSIGGLGVAADRELTGISLGVLGAGSGGEISGITLGGLGAGAGSSITGIVIGGLGAGSGGHISGVAIGGLGVGAQGNLSGLMIGLLGAGAGMNAKGVVIGGLGAGAGGNMTGIHIGGIGIGCGNELQGITIGGVGAGAPVIKGLTIAGLGVGAQHIYGVTLAGGMIKIDDEGNMTGFSASAFNQIKGTQTGLSLGILNYARHLNGVQIGLINYVRDNPKILRILPLLNFHFD